MLSNKNYKVAFFIRDQKHYTNIERYLRKSFTELPYVEFTFICESNIKTSHNFINLSEYLENFNIDIDKSNFYESLDTEIWKNKNVFTADPRYVAKTKKITWEDQYKLTIACRNLFKHKQFDLVLMGAASYTYWTIPHLVALEMDILSYKILFNDYINPFFEGVRVWFCTDPFWDLKTNSKFDFSWDKEKIQKHTDLLKQSLIEEDFNLDAKAVALKEQFTPSKLKNLLKNILKLFLRFDHLSYVRLKAYYDSLKNKKNYIDFEHLPNKFLLFPLNMPYDEQLLLRAPGYEDNYNNIKFIMDNLHDDCSLVIKEHPVNPGMLSNKILKELSKIYQNLLFISPTTPLRHILSKSKGLITVNSTAGLESLLVGKNTLVLGMGYYKDLDSVYKLSDNPINQILNDMCDDKNKVQEKEIDNLIEQMLNQTYPEPNFYPDKELEVEKTMNEAFYFKIKQLSQIR